MLFSTTIFLFAFLPIVLSLHFCLRTTEQRNVLLLAASLVFYAWGEATFILALISGLLGTVGLLGIATRRGRLN